MALALFCQLICVSISTAATPGSDAFVADGYLGIRPATQPSIAAFGPHLICVASATSYDPVVWSYSNDGGQSWTQGGDFVDGCGYGAEEASVCCDGSGNFTVVEYYSSCGAESPVLYRGAFSGNSFSWGGPHQILDGRTAGASVPYDFLQLVCDKPHDILYLTYSSTIQNGATDSVSFIVNLTRSIDHGSTWSTPIPLSDNASTGAHPAIGPNGEVYVAWEDYATGQLLIRRSDDSGQTFGPTVVVAAMQENIGSGPPSYRGNTDREYPPYKAPSCTGTFFAGFPSIDVDRTSGPYRGRVYVTWTPYLNGMVSPPLSSQGEGEPNNNYAEASFVPLGTTVSGVTSRADDPNQNVDIFAFDAPAGTTIQLDGSILRASPATTYTCHGFYLLGGADTSHLYLVGAMEVRAGTQPPLIYTVPVTGRYYIYSNIAGSALTYQFTLRVVQPTGGPGARDARDCVIAYSHDEGATWTAPTRVNDTPAGFDEALSTVAVDMFGKVNVIWYDRRDDGLYGVHPNTYWTFSRNGGSTFEPSTRLSSVSGEPMPWGVSESGAIWQIGDNLGLTTDGSHVYCAWTDIRSGTPQIYAAPIEVSDPTGIAVGGLLARLIDGAVHVGWQVSDARGITRIRVYRSKAGRGIERQVGSSVALRGEGSYEQVDPEELEPGDYQYRVEVLKDGAPPQWVGPVSVTIALASKLRWSVAAPNPFRDSVLLALELPRAGELQVRILTTEGREVARLANGYHTAGSVKLHWDGAGRNGRTSPAGVYLIQATLEKELATRRVVFVH